MNLDYLKITLMTLVINIAIILLAKEIGKLL